VGPKWYSGDAEGKHLHSEATTSYHKEHASPKEEIKARAEPLYEICP